MNKKRITIEVNDYSEVETEYLEREVMICMYRCQKCAVDIGSLESIEKITESIDKLMEIVLNTKEIIQVIKDREASNEKKWTI